MILKKVTIDGKQKYEEIEYEDALNFENPNELVFTDEDEKDDFFDELEERQEEAEEREEEARERAEEKIEEAKERIEDRLDEDDECDDFIENFKRHNSFFNRKRATSKTNKVLAMLPFMDDEDIKEIVDSIIENKEEYKDLEVSAVMPFLEDDECDRIFMEFVLKQDEVNSNQLTSMAPFVSEKCLSKLVDGYIEGKYQGVKMDGLYPFLSSRDVKRLFKYLMSK